MTGYRLDLPLHSETIVLFYGKDSRTYDLPDNDNYTDTMMVIIHIQDGEVKRK